MIKKISILIFVLFTIPTISFSFDASEQFKSLVRDFEALNNEEEKDESFYFEKIPAQVKEFAEKMREKAHELDLFQLGYTGEGFDDVLDVLPVEKWLGLPVITYASDLRAQTKKQKLLIALAYIGKYQIEVIVPGDVVHEESENPIFYSVHDLWAALRNSRSIHFGFTLKTLDEFNEAFLDAELLKGAELLSCGELKKDLVKK